MKIFIVATILIFWSGYSSCLFSQTIGWDVHKIEDKLKEQKAIYKVNNQTSTSDKTISTQDEYATMIYHFNTQDVCDEIYVKPNPVYSKQISQAYYFGLPHYPNSQYRIFDHNQNGYLLASLDYIGKERIIKISYSSK